MALTIDLGFYSHKGGTGVTVTTLIAAVLASEAGKRVLIVTDDLPTVCAAAGVACPEDATSVKLTHMVTAADGAALPDGFAPSRDLVVMSDGLTAAPTTRKVLVTRPCYLALRAECRAEVRPDAVVLIREPGRALSTRGLQAALNVDGRNVWPVPFEPAVARMVDAGLLLARLPQAVRGLRSLV